MANITFHAAADTSLNSGFYEVTEQNTVSTSGSLLVFSTPLDTTHHLIGNLFYDDNDTLLDISTITGFKAFDEEGVLMEEITNMNLTYEDYRTFVGVDNAFGLRQHISRFDDTVLGSNANDTLLGFEQDDLIYGRIGTDRLKGNTGDDSLKGGSGTDAVDGGADDDVLFGDSGNDALSGNVGDDLVVGGTGNDKLYGGAGSDRFIFHSDSGKDRIMDFGITDYIRIQQLVNGSSIQNFDDLDISIVNGSSVISLGNDFNFIVVDSVDNLTADDFIFFA